MSSTKFADLGIGWNWLRQAIYVKLLAKIGSDAYDIAYLIYAIYSIENSNNGNSSLRENIYTYILQKKYMSSVLNKIINAVQSVWQEVQMWYLRPEIQNWDWIRTA